ncbi:saccharopine dehydrogenase-like oxidoreductase [Bicyclus anynana]|uniref:Saccharopine dehydrogenase-like oxidoreductase n=1 Tax=Bicyclus anynana TaxID=110368 RepID=A0A6J1MYD6_BICAN|nr:saccharopine dehydrogenase-like oxidoreductase [Bicyclus anynana]XP_023939610.1 saccharopine dehydrogenase-like oxidoreductase [Bicyclus anynana]
MSERVDIVVFGATGYTGKFVVQELARVAPEYPGLRWAVAGRCRERLVALLRDVSLKTGIDLSAVRVMVADVADDLSLRSMCSQARLLVNCCGPFVRLGEPVVAAAVDCGAHYVDVSGEKMFVDILEKYDKIARAAGVCVVPTCGLSSVPADLGVVHLQDNFGGTLNSVESYLTIECPQKLASERTKGTVRYSSWESMINSMAAMTLIKPQKTLLPKLKPELKKRFFIHKNLNKWCLLFPNTDVEVVKKTQLNLLFTDKRRPVQYKAYITFLNIFHAIGLIFIGAILFILSKVSCTKNLLLNYPRLCSFGIVTYNHPKEGVMDDLCLQYDMLGEGWTEGVDIENTPPNRNVVGRIRVFGRDAPFVGTAVIVIFSALAILREQEKIPNRCGFMTPGVAFRNTSLIKNLCKNNFQFDIIEKT